jgi:tartrate dehydratase beta subunit/fumarate hydratase class I family protein
VKENAMTKLTFPFSEEKIRALKVGDEVLISGVGFTGRSQTEPA